MELALESIAQIDDVESLVAAVRQVQQRDGRLPSERQLADKLNVKRHQLRKALEALRMSGDLVAERKRRAPVAKHPSQEDLAHLTNPLEVLELRLLIEPGLARLASLRASALEIAQLRAAATTTDYADAGGTDLAFHLAVADASRNRLAYEFYRILRQVGVDSRLTIAKSTSPTCPKRIAARDAEHLAVADAVARRDPEAAEAAMYAHLLAVQKRINERIGSSALAM